MTEGPPTAAPPASASALESFEALLAELEAAIAHLDREELPLEDRLALHATAFDLQSRVERTLESAREAAAAVEREAETGPPEDTGPDSADPGPGEPYEALDSRSRETVERLERGDLPLAEVVRLHGEAHRLAAACDRILKTARGRVERLAAGRAEPASGGSGPRASRAGIGAPSRSPHPAAESDDNEDDHEDEDNGDAPF